MKRAMTRLGRPAGLVAAALGGASMASSSASCESAVDASLKHQIATGDSFIQAVGTKHAIGIIWGFSSVGILTILALSMRSAVRSERATSVIQAAEKVLVQHPVVRNIAGGPVFAAGSFRLGTGNTAAITPTASGWYNATVSGGVKGRVFLDAARSSRSAPWSLSYLRVVLDHDAIVRRNTTRRAQAVASGYMSQEAADEANAADAAAGAGAPAGGEGDGGVIDVVDSGSAAATAGAGAAVAAAGPGGVTVEYPAPGMVAIQVIGTARDHSEELPDFQALAVQAGANKAR